MKRVCAIALCLLLALACASPALAAEQRVFDYAGLFSSSEAAYLESMAENFRNATGMDAVILTSTDAEGKSSVAYADDFYDDGLFGTGADYSGFIFFIDMDNRVPTLTTCGAMIDYMTDARVESVLDGVYDYLASENYASAAETALNMVEGYYYEGIPAGQYRTDGKVFHLTFGGVVVAALISALVGFFVFLGVKRRYSLAGTTYSYDYAGNSKIHVTGASDTFVRTDVRRTAKASSSSSSGSKSTTHTSSSGRTHGGGSGRKF